MHSLRCASKFFLLFHPLFPEVNSDPVCRILPARAPRERPCVVPPAEVQALKPEPAVKAALLVVDHPIGDVGSTHPVLPTRLESVVMLEEASDRLASDRLARPGVALTGVLPPRVATISDISKIPSVSNATTDSTGGGVVDMPRVPCEQEAFRDPVPVSAAGACGVAGEWLQQGVRASFLPKGSGGAGVEGVEGEIPPTTLSHQASDVMGNIPVTQIMGNSVANGATLDNLEVADPATPQKQEEGEAQEAGEVGEVAVEVVQGEQQAAEGVNTGVVEEVEVGEVGEAEVVKENWGGEGVVRGWAERVERAVDVGLVGLVKAVEVAERGLERAWKAVDVGMAVVVGKAVEVAEAVRWEGALMGFGSILMMAILAMTVFFSSAVRVPAPGYGQLPGLLPRAEETVLRHSEQWTGLSHPLGDTVIPWELPGKWSYVDFLGACGAGELVENLFDPVNFCELSAEPEVAPEESEESPTSTSTEPLPAVLVPPEPDVRSSGHRRHSEEFYGGAAVLSAFIALLQLVPVSWL